MPSLRVVLTGCIVFLKVELVSFHTAPESIPITGNSLVKICGQVTVCSSAELHGKSGLRDLGR